MTTQLPPGKYKHYKGNYYIVIGTATHSETLEKMAIYYPEKEGPDSMWCRPLQMFTELVNNPEGNRVPRFAKVEDNF